MTSVWIWQRMLTPHMTALAEGLARRGVKVTFCAQQPVLRERARQGWVASLPEGVDVRFFGDRALLSALLVSMPSDAVHLIEGLRPVGTMGEVKRKLARMGARTWWMGEDIDERGARRHLKRLLYRAGTRRRCRDADRLLAFGERAQGWMGETGYPADRIHPFGYFLRASDVPVAEGRDGPFRIMFAGRLEQSKRLDLLLDALRPLAQRPFDLQVTGKGSLSLVLRAEAERLFGQRLHWTGQLPMDAMREQMAGADLIVLPSDYDGWGTVLTEALIEGSRVICTDGCGARLAVREAPGCGIVPSGDVAALARAIAASLDRGPVLPLERQGRKNWAHCLTAEAGAEYLLGLIEGKEGAPPWLAIPAAQGLAA